MSRTRRTTSQTTSRAFADAARAKPSFDVVVRELTAATGEQKTGLKKTSRVVEKSALRPGAGRGRSKWVCDVVRAMLVATSMSAVGSIVRGLLALHEAGALFVFHQCARETSRAFVWDFHVHVHLPCRVRQCTRVQ